MWIIWLVISVFEVKWLKKAIQMQPKQFPTLKPDQFDRKRRLAIWSPAIFFIALGLNYLLQIVGVLLVVAREGHPSGDIGLLSGVALLIISLVCFPSGLIVSAILGTMSLRIK